MGAHVFSSNGQSQQSVTVPDPQKKKMERGKYLVGFGGLLTERKGDTLGDEGRREACPHLVVHQRVKPLPVTLYLGGNVFILQHHSGNPALAPLWVERMAWVAVRVAGAVRDTLSVCPLEI